jgi:hypothetical protein
LATSLRELNHQSTTGSGAYLNSIYYSFSQSKEMAEMHA